MKIRLSILWTCVAAVVFVLAIWFARRPTETPAQLSATPDATEQPPVQPTSRYGNAFPVRTNVQAATQAAATSSLSSPAEKSKVEQIRETLAAFNDVPIIFYGKLEDQFGDPVVGAEITASTIIYNGKAGGTGKAFVTSDANGLFKLDCGSGESLGVAPRKEGYLLATKETEFKYSHLYENHFLPDPNSPVVMRMWKLQGAQQLIHFLTTKYIPLDGTAVAFDVQTGKQAESGGDMVVSIKSPSAPNVVQRYDWKASIQGVDGGLIRSSDDFEQMFEAPDSGYQPRFEVTYQQNARPWSSGFEGVFYLKIRGGRLYGKVAVELTTDVVRNDAVPVTLSGYINASGTRNLEIDPKLVTEAHQ